LGFHKGTTVTSVRSDVIPVPYHTDKTIPPKVVVTGMMITGRIWPDETGVRSYLLRDGIHNEGPDLEAIQASENHEPNGRDCDPPAPQDNKAIVT
jgi:hypothetical protein